MQTPPVIGLGYVGLPRVVEFSKQLRTIGFDQGRPGQGHDTAGVEVASGVFDGGLELDEGGTKAGVCDRACGEE